jgi:hypothetical protein
VYACMCVVCVCGVYVCGVCMHGACVWCVCVWCGVVCVCVCMWCVCVCVCVCVWCGVCMCVGRSSKMRMTFMKCKWNTCSQKFFFNNPNCWEQKWCKSFLNGSKLAVLPDNGTVNLITALMMHAVLHCNTTGSTTCQTHVTICLTYYLKTIMVYVCLFVVYLTTLTVTRSTKRRITG